MMTTTTTTDKEFRLSKIRKSRRTKEVDQQTGDVADIHTNDIDHEQHYDGDDDDYECRTPTAKENEIPAPRTCPPAPTKIRRRPASTAIVLCKTIKSITSPNNVIDQPAGSNDGINGTIELLDGHECRTPPSPPQIGSPVTPTSINTTVVLCQRISSSWNVVTDKNVGDITGGTEGIELIDNHMKEETEGCREQDNGDDENDGYRTPTSEEHKIAVRTICPPAPRVKRIRSPISPASAVVIFKRRIYQRKK